MESFIENMLGSMSHGKIADSMRSLLSCSAIFYFSSLFILYTTDTVNMLRADLPFFFNHCFSFGNLPFIKTIVTLIMST